jgi:hypothetical protein
MARAARVTPHHFPLPRIRQSGFGGRIEKLLALALFKTYATRCD